jgi:alkylhydroperoxidase family enzyme
MFAFLSLTWLLSLGSDWPSKSTQPKMSAFGAPLTNEECWRRLPPATEGAGQPLPVWIHALAVTSPKLAAAMIDLDYAQRAESTLPPKLRAKLRWIAAHANRCEYAKSYARADYLRAGGQAEDIDDLVGQLDTLPEAESLALKLVRQLVESAYTVSDSQVTRLVELYGEKQVVGIVLVAAYASFQDRLFLALGASVEPDGPLAPVRVRFLKPAPAIKPAEGKREVSSDKSSKPAKRKASPPAKNPPKVPEKVDDPEWTSIPFESLQDRLSHQLERRKARVRIPDGDAVLKNIPVDVHPPDDAEMLIRWCRLNYGYQSRLTAAWLGALDVFHEESDLDMVFHESMFWVVTRSSRCFY